MTSGNFDRVPRTMAVRTPSGPSRRATRPGDGRGPDGGQTADRRARRLSRTDAAEVARAARALRRHWRAASPEVRAAGRQWYPRAGAVARRLAREAPAGIGPAAVADVIAALSPRVRWSHNLADAAAMVRAAGRAAGDEIFGDLAIDGAAQNAARMAFPGNIRRAARILAGDPAREHLSGPKVCAFARAIRGDTDAVTIDVWAAKAAGYDPDRLTPRRLRIIGAAYRRVAAEVGETPRDFQAIVWMSVRGEKPSDPADFLPERTPE